MLGLGVGDGFLINLYFHKYLGSCTDTVRNVYHVMKPEATQMITGECPDFPLGAHMMHYNGL